MTNLSNNSNINKNNKSLKTIISNISNLFFQKYYINEFEYGRKVINDIIFNEPSHIVALFKDFLIIDDYSEFLKRFYKKYESLERLPQFCLYYETYSRIYPNYTPLKESIYIYKNIHKKQKMIDKQQKNESEEKKKENKKHKRNYDKDDLVFSTDIYNSIINDSEDLYNLLFGINKNCENSEKTQEDFNKIINEINKFENPFYTDISYEKDNTNNKNNNIKNNLNNYNRNIKGKLFSLCSKTKNKDSKSNNFINGKYNNGNLLKELQLLNSFNHRKANSSTSNNTSIKKINKNSSNKINKNNNNNNIINNNINNNNNNSYEKNNINCLKTIKPSDSDLNCTFTTTNTTFISKSNENILNISNDKIKLLFSRKEKSRFDFVENSNINKKRDEIIIPDFIRKITDKACNMIPLTKYYKNNNFINDIFLYKEELNECNNNNENWKKYFIKSYNDKKEMFLKNPSNKDILLKDFEKINNFVLKNNNKSA